MSSSSISSNSGSGPKVANFYEKCKDDKSVDKNPNFKTHGIKIPFRMLLVGASGSMKTNTALDILSKFSGTFDHVTVVCRNRDEPLYNLLSDSIDEDQLTMIEIDGDDLSNLPKIDDLTKDSPPTLVIFDDLVLVKNQRPIEEFFIRARKVQCSCMYLTQSYYPTPKTIRLNCNYIVLKKVSCLRDLNMLLKEYSLSVDIQELNSMYTRCTQNKLDWLMVSIDNPPDKRFFHNYTPISSSAVNETSDHPTSDKITQPPPPRPQSSSLGKRKGAGTMAKEKKQVKFQIPNPPDDEKKKSPEDSKNSSADPISPPPLSQSLFGGSAGGKESEFITLIQDMDKPYDTDRFPCNPCLIPKESLADFLRMYPEI